MIDVILSSYEQQTLQNAIDFLQKARNTTEEDPIEYWSNSAWAIISFATCIEAYLTGHILAKIGEHEIPNSKITGYNFGFTKKIRYIEQDLKTQISDSTHDWQNVVDVMRTRNSIIHFNKIAITSLLTVDNAEKARDACKYVINRCKICFDAKLPQWVEQFAS
jgi:hypothetical protein